MNVEYTDEFIVENLGIMEEYVYDIEVEDNHNFFANNILVHNSMYIDMGSLVEKMGLTDELKTVEFLDKFCKEKIQPYLDKCFEDLHHMMGSYKQEMSMKREAISSSALWRGKKMYVLNVWDLEGVRYTEPKLKLQGIESTRSSTPEICRNKITEGLKIILNKDEDSLQKFVSEFKEEYDKLPFENIAFPRSVKGLYEYSDRVNIYKKGTPIHVKGALMYNHIIKQKGLHYPEIKNGDKIRFCYMVMPNPLKEKVIAVPDTLPKELGLEEYIDRQLQFEKTFLGPIQSFTDLIGWSPEKRTNLMDFFS